MYKKIVLACAMLATAGLLSGCGFLGVLGAGDKGLREEVYEQLQRIPEGSCIIHEKDRIITAKTSYSFFDRSLEVEIRNSRTGDTLTMIDDTVVVRRPFDLIFDGGYLRGVDRVMYNGLRNGTKGMDKRFDEALKILKPKLEEKIKNIDQGIYEVKENTKLY